MTDFAQRLGQARVKSGITEAELGKAVGVGAAVVRKWESDASNSISAANAFAVADALQVSARWLVTGQGEPDSDSTLFPYPTLDDYVEAVRQLLKARPLSASWIQELLDGDAHYVELSYQARKPPVVVAFELYITEEESKREPDNAEPRFTLDLNEKVKKHLKRLVELGLWGESTEEAARLLVEQSLAAKLESGLLRPA